ncbi:MAG: RNA methyltransferase [Spirochaetales bacterium]
MTATKRQLTAWAALKNRKDRDEQGLFLAEGVKLVADIVAAGWALEALLEVEPSAPNSVEVTAEQMARVSGLRTPASQLAVVRRPPAAASGYVPGSLVLLLDGVQDPGNVGTIVRTADWFGISQVVCSPDTADPWQPKAIQATMGAFLRVDCPVVGPLLYLHGLPPGTPVFGTFLEGENLFTADLPASGVVVLGNEGHGIRPELAAKITRRLTIPRFGAGGESLNVAAATALVGAEFRRHLP